MPTSTINEDTAAADPHFNSEDAVLTERQSNRIPAYKVFEKTAALPEEQRLAIRWLHAHYYDSGKGLAEVGLLVGYDGGTVSKVFGGKYEGDLGAFTKSIERYRRLQEERGALNRAPYIETDLYRDIEECCQASLTYQKAVFLYGESQVGKTAALKHYAEQHNHGETIYVEMPVGGSLSHFLAVLSSKLRMSNQTRGDVQAVNIMRCLGPQNLLIVDECSRAMQSRSYGGASLKTMDFLRALMDNTGCGLVLCGTNVFRDQMADRALSKFLNQFNRRCLIRRQLPDVPSEGDLAAFAAHYGLAPASGEELKLQTAIVREHGLGVWLTTLTAAARKVSKEAAKPGGKGVRMTWQHVVKAHAFLRRMEQPVGKGGAS